MNKPANSFSISSSTLPVSVDLFLKWFWSVANIMVMANLMILLIHLLHLSEIQLVQFIYDDGFYYLIIAKNFYHLHYWTFDSGNTITSGFQPLFAYCLLILYALFNPNNLQYIHLALCLTMSITLLSFIWLTLIKIPQKWALLATAALITSTLNFSYNAITIVEWPFVVLFSTSYIAYLFIIDSQQLNIKSCFILAVIAFMGSLTRADFGGLPLMFFGAAIILNCLIKERNIIKLTLIGLIGACLGECAVFLHDYLFTGHLLQSSAIMKLNWSNVTGPTPYAFYSQIMSLMTNNFNQDGVISVNPLLIMSVPILILIAINYFAYKGICSIVQSKNSANSGSSTETTITRNKNMLIVLGSLLTIIFYCIFYAFNTGALQPWYTGIIIAPLIVVITGILSSFESHFAKTIISFVITLAVLAHIIQLYSLSLIPWPSQQSLYKAGVYLQQHPSMQRIGSWNAGIISYNDGDHIINLDGLMNDEIYPYVKADHLECYIIKKNIRYIVDTKLMFNDYHKARGGYTQNLANWLIPWVNIDQNATIYQVNREGLIKNNVCN